MITYLLYVREFGYWVCVGEYEREFDAEIVALGYGFNDTMVIKCKDHNKRCYLPSYGKVWDDLETEAV